MSDYTHQDDITSLCLHDIPIFGRENEIQCLDRVYYENCCGSLQNEDEDDGDHTTTTTTTTTDASEPDEDEHEKGDDCHAMCHVEGHRKQSSQEASVAAAATVAAPSAVAPAASSPATTTFVAVRGKAGCGKSSLIYSRKKEWVKKRSKRREGCIFASGKYESIRSSEPLSAIVDAMNDLLLSVLTTNSAVTKTNATGGGSADDDDNDHNMIKGSLVQTIKSDSRILKKILPKVFDIVGIDDECVECNDDDNKNKNNVFKNDLQQKETSIIRSHAHSMSSQDNNNTDMVKLALRRVLSCLCSISKRPIVLFIDDIQWADKLSVEVLKVLALSTNLSRLLLIVAYREEEVDQHHLVSTTFDSILQNSGSTTNSAIISLDDLNVDAVNKIILAATKTIDGEYTAPLSLIVHKLTHGNPFFILQFLSLLYKEGFLYYSISRLQWVFADVTIIEKEMNISENVVDIVLASMRKLPKQTQESLMVASCLGTEVPIYVLNEYGRIIAKQKNCNYSNKVHIVEQSLSSSPSSSLKEEEEVKEAGRIIEPHGALVNSLDAAVNTGIIKYDTEKQTLRWSHDKLQASAYALMPEGTEGEKIHLRLGKLLLKMRSSSKHEEWMIYMSADQLNRVSPLLIVDDAADESSSNGNNNLSHDGGISRFDLIELSLEAAQLSISKCAFYPAAKFLRSAASHLDGGKWWAQHYDLCLEVFNLLLEMEFEIGNHDACNDAINKVLANANNLEDRFRAHVKLLAIATTGKDRDYDKGIRMTIEILSSYGVQIPNMNSIGAKRYIYLERQRLFQALPDGNIESLVVTPLMSDPKAARICTLLIDHLGKYAVDSGNWAVCRIASYRALSLSVKYGVHHNACSGIIFLSVYYMMKEKFKVSYEYAELAVQLVSRFKETPGGSHCKVLGAAFSSILPMMRPFHTLVDGLLNANRAALRIGEMEWVSLTSIFYSLCHICIGLPIIPLEHELIRFNNQARQFGRPLSVCAIFQILRQTIINLRDPTIASSTSLSGAVMDQDAMLSSMEGKSLSMTLRDISTFRLMLSCIYGDWDTAKKMLDIVSTYPFHDMITFRGHIRLLYTGMSALVIGRERGIRKYTKLGKNIIKRMTNEVKAGAGVNVHPVLLMLLAEESPSKARFDEASRICGRSGLTHHEAYICERAALYYMNNRSSKDEGWPQYYIGRAVALYNDWGAAGKVAQLQSRYRDQLQESSPQLRSTTVPSKGAKFITGRRSSTFGSIDVGSKMNEVLN